MARRRRRGLAGMVAGALAAAVAGYLSVAGGGGAVPTADAGEGDIAIVTVAYQLGGSCSDGNPTWTQTVGAGSCDFSPNNTTINPTVTCDTVEAVTFELECDNGQVSDPDPVTITFVPFFSDDFSAASLASYWSETDAVGNCTPSLTGNGTADAYLEIAVPSGTTHDPWNTDNACKMLQAAGNVNFGIEAKFDSVPGSNDQSQGIYVFQDAGDFVRFDVFRSGGTFFGFAATCVAGTCTAQQQNAITSSDPIWLRLSRAGNSWTAQYSNNGTGWTTHDTFSHTMTVTSVGVFGGNFTSNPAYTAQVDYFFETSAPVSPEDPTGGDDPPAVSAGPNRSALPDEQIVLAASCSDDVSATCAWTVEGTPPGTCTWSATETGLTCNATAPDLGVACDTEGTYTLRLTGNDGVNSPTFDEMTLTVEDTPSGTWPSTTEPLGHEHPDCATVCPGMDAEDIEATSCGISGAVAASTTIDCCAHNSIIDLNGDDITFDCVYWDTGNGAGFGMGCANAGGCSDATFRRVTAKGSAGNTVQNLFRLTDQRGGDVDSILIEDCDIMESDVMVYCGSAINADGGGASDVYTGEEPYALIVRHSRFRNTTLSPSAHADHIFLSEGCNGVLIENNVFDGPSGDNNGSLLQAQTGSVGAGDYLIQGNRWIHDGSGHMFNLDRAAGSPSQDACAQPVDFLNNRFDWVFDLSDGFSDTLFNFDSGAGKDCPDLDGRTDSDCTGNVFGVGGSALCTGDGT